MAFGLRGRAVLIHTCAFVNAPSTRPTLLFPASQRSLLAACGLLILAAMAVYANSFSGPFIFDDIPSIRENLTIRHFSTALFPPNGGLTVSGRPVLNLSFALNYAISGNAVWSYHALNLVIHLLAGLTLFGIVRRTLERGRLRENAVLGGFFPGSADENQSLTTLATLIALAVAVLWTLHPLQTESVTYLVQRGESLVGLFYLLTLYCFVRGAASANSRLWYPMAIAACLLGMATKEVMVSAPVLVLLYDRTFLAGSFRAAWRQRRWLYAGLAATWLLLAWLVLGTANRGGTAGFGVGVGFWQYAATQFETVARYLWLSIWPHPLIIDYGAQWVKAVPDVIPYALVVALVLAGTAAARRRRPALGFLGAWFLAILAPTSLVPGNRQTMAEHRMYLALAPVIVLLVLAVHASLRRRSWVVLLAAAVGLGWMTVQRNKDYRSELAIWHGTAAKRPHNAWALSNYGAALFRQGKPAEALVQYEKALRVQPTLAEAYYNAANALSELGRMPETIGHYEAALELKPDYVEAHNNLGNILLQAGRLPEAIRHYETVVRIQPDSAEAHYNLGNALFRAGRTPEAVQHLETALHLNPAYAEASYNLGTAFLKLGRLPEAKAQFEQALRVRPDYSQAHNNLGNVLAQTGSLPQAVAHYQAALQIDPANAEAHNNLGVILMQQGRLQEAKEQFGRALRLQPDYAQARENLDRAEALRSAAGIGK